MAYPTVAVQSFQHVGENSAQFQAINENSTTQKHPLGTRVRAIDVGTGQLGEAEFIYLKGVASTAAGDMVSYDQKAGATVRLVDDGNVGCCAVAMSACVASQFGWYCIRGAVPVASVTGTAQNPVFQTATAGTVDSSSVAGDMIFGAWFIVTGAGGFSFVQLANPFAAGVAPP